MGENTKHLLLREDNEARWFLALAEQSLGPLTLSDIYDKIQSGEVTWAHFIWRAGWSGWKRICDAEEFRAAVPLPPVTQPPRSPLLAGQAPRPAVRAAERGRADREPSKRVWYLYSDQSQSGPFSAEEVQRMIRVGHVRPRAHAWRDGMSNWERLEKLPDFAQCTPQVAPQGPLKEAAPQEQRSTPRRPLVARVIMVADKPIDESLSVGVAICRDVSIGGMQVLTAEVPGNVGTRLRLNVTPTGGDRKAPPFTAEGVIVRILEDRRGFSFRFEKLSDSARKVIEQYVSDAE